MHKLFSIIILMAVSHVPTSADSTMSKEVLQILNQAQRAASELRSISYDGSLLADGMLAGTFTDYTGKVKVKFADSLDALQIHIVGSRVFPNAPGATDFQYVSDGSKAFLIDGRNQTFMSGTVQEGRVPEREAIFPSAFFGKSAYVSELRAAKAELTGMAVVNEVECDILDIHYDLQGRRRARLHIGKSDHVIRRIERPIMYAAGGPTNEFNATITIQLENVRLNALPADSSFTLSKPAGYVDAHFPGAKSAIRSVATADPGAKKGPEQEGLRKVAQSAPAQRSGALQVGAPAPEWTLKNGEGKDVALKDLRGKVVVLDFWATWCGPCKMAMPGVQRISERYKDKPVAVFGVNCMERSPNSDPLGVIKQKQVTYGQLLNGTSVAAQYGVRGIPSFAVIGKDGSLLYSGSGFSPEAIENAVERGLKN